MIWLSFFICSVRRCFLACFTRLKTRIDFLIKLRHIRDVSDMNEILHISILPMHPAGDFGWYVLMLGQNRATHSYEIISSKLGKGMFSIIQNSLSLCLRTRAHSVCAWDLRWCWENRWGLVPLKTCLILVNCIGCTQWANTTTTHGPAKDFRWSWREKEEAQCGAGKWKTRHDSGLPTEGVAMLR